MSERDRMTRGLSVSLARIVDEAAAACLLLTELGFEPSEIFVGPRDVINARPRGLWATVTSRRGGRENVVVVAHLGGEAAADDFRRAWRAFAATPLLADDQIRILRATVIDEQKLVESLTTAGFFFDANDRVCAVSESAG